MMWESIATLYFQMFLLISQTDSYWKFAKNTPPLTVNVFRRRVKFLPDVELTEVGLDDGFERLGDGTETDVRPVHS